MLALLINKICNICQSYLSDYMFRLFLDPTIYKRISVILLYPSTSELFPRSANNRKFIDFSFDQLIPQLLLFIEAEIERDKSIEARGEVESTEDMMGISRGYLLISTLNLCVGLLEEEDPQRSALCSGKCCLLLVILENWDQIIDNYLLGFTIYRNIQFVDTFFVRPAIPIKNILYIFQGIAIQSSQSGQKVRINLIQLNNLFHTLLLQNRLLIMHEAPQPPPRHLPPFNLLHHNYPRIKLLIKKHLILLHTLLIQLIIH